MTDTLLAPDDIAQAVALLPSNPREGNARLNAIFRAGTVPGASLHGRTTGGLAATSLGGPFDALVGFIVRAYMPWQGKTFDAAAASGDNIFTHDSRKLGRIFTPFYRDYIPDTAKTYRAFRFKTYAGPGLEDPDRQVLKIDYNLPVNPALTVRRIVDELVQVDERFYLGKAHVRWWWGAWQRVAFFTLTSRGEAARKGVG
ncbi:MAG: hypothetical protein HY259_07155 [Chloroflexi bacterium]|nr:hypothetical protein [Chloroflexota bacterium]